jgi:nuclear transport factor 2 (NTF2) superfamily protein
MTSVNPSLPPADDLPFVHEECGDSLWGPVLAQPDPAPETRPPLPPFTAATAAQKVQAAEDAWNTRNPEKVSRAYTPDTEWRNRTEFLRGRAAVQAFLAQKWARELDYKLKKELWSFTDNRIAVRFEYEYHDAAGQWFRAYGNEMWEFTASGLMQHRYASINEAPIREDERRLR